MTANGQQPQLLGGFIKVLVDINLLRPALIVSRDFACDSIYKSGRIRRIRRPK